MSLVYVNDVADVIMKLLDPKPQVLDQAFNLAFKETPTLLEFLTDMKVCVLMFFVFIQFEIYYIKQYQIL